MAYQGEITREAQTEVTETFVWKGEHQSFEKASEWYNGIMNALYSLEEMPGCCALVPENEDFKGEIVLNQPIILRTRLGVVKGLSPLATRLRRIVLRTK